MIPKNQDALTKRVRQAAEAALAQKQYACTVDVLLGIGLLSEQNVRDWREGRVDFLERVAQTNLKKLSFVMKTFRCWAEEKGLHPRPTRYTRKGRHQRVDLRFSKSGDPNIELHYSTHFVSPKLNKAMQEQEQKQEDPKKFTDPVVFEIIRDSRCSECGAWLWKGSLLSMESGQPLCLPCTVYGDLEFLPRGDGTLTRRAAKHSARKAVVVRFSRARGRYERQGILVEDAALQRAEQECFDDADERAQRRVQHAKQRQRDDQKLVVQMSARIRELFPGCPPDEAEKIAAHTAVRGSGRVGRSASGRALEEAALTLAVAAAVRHRHTRYDKLLAGGIDRAEARAMVSWKVEGILNGWRQQDDPIPS